MDDMGHLLIKIILRSRGWEWQSGGNDNIRATYTIGAGREFVHGLRVVGPCNVEGTNTGGGGRLVDLPWASECATKGDVEGVIGKSKIFVVWGKETRAWAMPELHREEFGVFVGMGMKFDAGSYPSVQVAMSKKAYEVPRMPNKATVNACKKQID
eukprot:scaffold163985_cov68-Attheya_sp.AAC.1